MSRRYGHTNAGGRYLRPGFRIKTPQELNAIHRERTRAARQRKAARRQGRGK